MDSFYAHLPVVTRNRASTSASKRTPCTFDAASSISTDLVWNQFRDIIPTKNHSFQATCIHCNHTFILMWIASGASAGTSLGPSGCLSIPLLNVHLVHISCNRFFSYCFFWYFLICYAVLVRIQFLLACVDLCFGYYCLLCVLTFFIVVWLYFQLGFLGPSSFWVYSSVNLCFGIAFH